MSNKLKDRIASYQEASDYKLLARLPIIITLNGRAFTKATELLDKPYDPRFAECILSTTMRLCNEIEGATFAYQHNDEIVVVARNDQSSETSPWYNNHLQKICSTTSSMATLHFNQCANAIGLNLVGDAIFLSQVFTVPNISEVTNTMIYKQQYNFLTSIQFACFYELLKRFDKNTIRESLMGLSIDEKIDLLQQECGMDFNDYPIPFRRGAACYRVPKLLDGHVKHKWSINTELPIFTKEQSFLGNILKGGSDILRAGF